MNKIRINKLNNNLIIEKKVILICKINDKDLKRKLPK